MQEVLKSDPQLQTFLSVANIDYAKSLPPINPIQTVRDLVTPDSRLEIYPFDEYLSDQINDYLRSFESSYTQIYQNFKELAADFDNVCHTLTRIHSSFETLSALHKHSSINLGEGDVMNPEQHYYQMNQSARQRTNERLAHSNMQMAETFGRLALEYWNPDKNIIIGP